MSLEQGIVQLVQGDPAVALIATAGGGFLAELPANFLNPDGSFVTGPPTWTFLHIPAGRTQHTLAGERGPRECLFQIDCYGVDAGSTIILGLAIDDVLDNFSGVFTDNASPPNITGVTSCLEEHDPRDAPFDSASRTFRRTLEYRVFYS